MVPGLMLPLPQTGTQVMEVPAGATATLRCSSNDDSHNFMFWQLGQNQIIGPGNDYDPSKYKYEVLSGRLHINSVSPQETGYYRCISKHISRGNLNVGAVEMIVGKQHNQAVQQLMPMRMAPVQSVAEKIDDMMAVKIICIIISLIVLTVCAVVFYKMKKEEDKRNARLVMFNEDEDDDGSGDEIYNRTTTDIIRLPENSKKAPTPRAPSPTPGTSRPRPHPAEHITGIDNQGLDTDFSAAFEQISINAANRNNLI